jgi:AraC family transcriptional regulator, transcriptional activator of pobA
MEPDYATTQIFSLRRYVQLYLDGTIAIEPYAYLIIWLTGESRERHGANTFCLYQPNYAALQNLQSKDGYVLSFPIHYFDTLKGTDIPASFNSLFHIRTFTVAQECQWVLDVLRQEIEREITRPAPSPLKDEIMKSLLNILIIRLSYESGNAQPVDGNTGDIRFATRFFELIRTHFVSKKKVSDYSEMMHVSANYLNSKIKLATGYSASYHINQRVAVEAKRLAIQNKLLLKEVAYELGYQDTAHFSKWFKNFVGVNFTNYQRQHCLGTVAGK